MLMKSDYCTRKLFLLYVFFGSIIHLVSIEYSMNLALSTFVLLNYD